MDTAMFDLDDMLDIRNDKTTLPPQRSRQPSSIPQRHDVIDDSLRRNDVNNDSNSDQGGSMSKLVIGLMMAVIFVILVVLIVKFMLPSSKSTKSTQERSPPEVTMLENAIEDINGRIVNMTNTISTQQSIINDLRDKLRKSSKRPEVPNKSKNNEPKVKQKLNQPSEHMSSLTNNVDVDQNVNDIDDIDDNDDGDDDIIAELTI